MAKLSQQILSRPTRTQRVLGMQKERREKREFASLKSQAEQIRLSRFSNIKTIEEYESEYNRLNPEIRQFFSSPEALREDKTARVTQTSTQIQEKITYAKQRLINAELSHEKQMQDIRKKRSQSPKDAEYYKKKEDREDDKLEETQAYWNAYIGGLNEGLGKLRSNEDLDYKDILGYADDLGDYERDSSQAQNRERIFKKKKAEEVRKLEEQGYKPMLIQVSDKGKLEKEKIVFHHPTLKKYADYSISLTTKGKDVSKFQPSKLGISEVGRTLKIGKEEYTFKTHEKLYKTPSGKLTTELGGLTARTEKQIMSDAKEKAYQDFEKEYPKVKIDKIIADDKKWYEKSPTRVKVRAGAYYLFGKVKEGRRFLKENVRYDFKIISKGIPKGLPKVSVISFGKQKQEVDIAEKIDEHTKKITDIQLRGTEKYGQDIFGVKGYTEFTAKKEIQLKQECTSLFYRSEIGKEVFFSEDKAEIEKAFKQYQATTEFKQYETQYQKEYKKELDAMFEAHDFSVKDHLNRAFMGFGMAGLDLGKTAISILSSPTDTALVVGALYGAGALLKHIPSYVSTGIDIAFVTSGTSKVLNKTSSLSEVGSGLIMAGVGGISLTAKGVAYAGRPSFPKRTKLPSPRISLKASETKGYQTSINKIVFENQKLSQVGRAGSMQPVNVKWRKWLGLKNIYGGVPYSQRGIYTLKSLRGTYQLPLQKSGYQKAYKLLTKRGGFTPYGAKAKLRYDQPRVIDTILKKGDTTFRGSKALARSIHLTKQPVIKVDDLLGIKTRGARTIATADIERRFLTTKSIYGKERMIAVTDKVRASAYLKRGATQPAFKDWDYSRGFTYGKETGLKKGYDILRMKKSKVGFEIVKLSPEKYAKYLMDKGKLRIGYMDLPKDMAGGFSNLKGKPSIYISDSLSKNYLSKIRQKVIAHELGHYVQPKFISKKFFKKLPYRIRPEELFAKRYAKLKVKEGFLVHQPKTTQGWKVFEKVKYKKLHGVSISKKLLPSEKVIRMDETRTLLIRREVKDLVSAKYIKPFGIKKTPLSKTFGNIELKKKLKEITGIGKTKKTITDQVLATSTKDILKQTIAPPQVSVKSQIKNILKADATIKVSTSSKAILSMASLSMVRQTSKQKTHLKSYLKTNLNLMNKIKQDVAMKQAISQKTTQVSLSKQIQTLISSPTIPKGLSTFTFKETPIPSPSKIIIPPFFFPSVKGKEKKKKSLKKQIQELAYLPDFTARAIGLEPETITQKQAQAKLKKLLTGLEIRRGVILK